MIKLIFKFPLTGETTSVDVDSIADAPLKEDVINVNRDFYRVDCRVLTHFTSVLGDLTLYEITLRLYPCQDPGINDKK